MLLAFQPSQTQFSSSSVSSCSYDGRVRATKKAASQRPLGNQLAIPSLPYSFAARFLNS